MYTKFIFINTCIISFLLILLVSACSEVRPEPEIHTVTDDEAEEYDRLIREGVAATVAEERLALWGGQGRPGNMSIDVMDGLNLSLWASEKLLSDPIAISMDEFGRSWVTVTKRSKSSEPDIRQHPEWMIESISLETVEDRREFLRKHLSTDGSYDRDDTFLSDINGDGQIDWRDLTVEKEEVWRIEDQTGNGFANHSQLFIRNFNEEISEAAGAVLYHEGDLFLGLAPDMWRLRDTTGDGMADWKESISHGYCVNIGFCGHLMSGLTVGPAGRIYWNAADSGFSVVDQEGKRWHYPREGGILRSEPDGSNFEVFSTGVRNTFEFNFDKYGNLITFDNDGDFPDEYERLVHLIDGSDTGWRTNWEFGKYVDPKNNTYNPWGHERYYEPRFEDQAAHILPPLAPYPVGPAGMTYNPGTALNEEWDDHFFIMRFPGAPPRGTISAVSLKPNGASFELDRDEVVVQGLLAVGLDIGPDGALYFSDWVDGWFTNGLGRIWKVDVEELSDDRQLHREETGTLLAEDFRERPAEDLTTLLQNNDMRVRQKAQFEFARRGDTASLLSKLENSEHQLARIHGIWGLAQIGRRDLDAVAPLIGFLDDEDSEIRAQAARWLGDVSYHPAAEYIVPLLEDEEPRVRFFATEALGRIGYEQALEPIVAMLEDNDDQDVYLRHSGAIALARIGNDQAVANLADHPSRAVRIAAIVALKRLESPGSARFLADEDEFIVTNAARAINDDAFIEEALPALAGMLDQQQFVNEPLIRRSVNANLYGGNPENAQRLGNFALREDVKEELRVEALQTLSVWPSSSTLDRVTGEPRGRVENDPEMARQALGPVVREVPQMASSAVRVATVEAAGALGYKDAIPVFFTLLKEDASPEVRRALLYALIDLEFDRIDDAIVLALEDTHAEVRGSALGLIPGLDLPQTEMVDLLDMAMQAGDISERQLALETLGGMEGEAVEALLSDYLDLLVAGELAHELELELFEAIERTGNQALRAVLADYRSGLDIDERLTSEYVESLYGGNAASGERVFMEHPGAQCIRCHAVGGQGGEAGPDLSNVGDRLSRDELLLSMIDPNAILTPGYRSVVLTMQDGETVRGALRAETDEQIIVESGGQRYEIEKENIIERVNSPSAMPAMENILSRYELRNLVEYLSTLSE